MQVPSRLCWKWFQLPTTIETWRRLQFIINFKRAHTWGEMYNQKVLTTILFQGISGENLCQPMLAYHRKMLAYKCGMYLLYFQCSVIKFHNAIVLLICLLISNNIAHCLGLKFLSRSSAFRFLSQIGLPIVANCHLCIFLKHRRFATIILLHMHKKHSLLPATLQFRCCRLSSVEKLARHSHRFLRVHYILAEFSKSKSKCLLIVIPGQLAPFGASCV